MQKDLPDFLQLYHCLHTSRARLFQLLQGFDGSARQVLQGSPASLRACGIDQRTATRILRAAMSRCSGPTTPRAASRYCCIWRSY